MLLHNCPLLTDLKKIHPSLCLSWAASISKHDRRSTTSINLMRMVLVIYDFNKSKFMTSSIRKMEIILGTFLQLILIFTNCESACLFTKLNFHLSILSFFRILSIEFKFEFIILSQFITV